MSNIKLIPLTDGFFRLLDELCCFTDFKIIKNSEKDESDADELIIEISSHCDEYVAARHIIAGYYQLTERFSARRIKLKKEGESVICPVSAKDSPLGISVRYEFMAEVSASNPSP